MIRHAWSLLSEKHIVDSETNNLFVHVVDRIQGVVPRPNHDQDRVLVPTSMRLVSLWYRLEPAPERGAARITVLSPDEDEVGRIDLELRLDTTRARTIVQLGAIPYVDAGVYQYVVSLAREGIFQEVARVPLDVHFDIVAMQ